MPAVSRRTAFLLLLLIFLLVTWASRIYLSELALTSTLRNYGMHDIAIDIDKVGPGESRISSIRLSVLTKEGILRLDAKDLRLNYTFDQLAARHVDSVTIGTLVVNYVIVPGNEPETVTVKQRLEPVALIAGMRHALREYIAFNELHIDNIIPKGVVFGVFDQRKLQLDGTKNNGVFNAVLSLQEPLSRHSTQLPRINITKLTEDAFSANMDFSDSSDSPAVKLDLAIHDTGLRGSYRIHPQRLNSLLKPLVELDIPATSDVIHGTLSTETGPDDLIITSVNAATKRYEHNTYIVDDATVKLNIHSSAKNPFQQIQLQPGSYLNAGSLRIQDFSLPYIRLSIIGELGIHADTWQYTGNISSTSLDARYQAQLLRLADIAARISLTPGNLDISGDFSTASLPGQFKFALEHNLETGSGQLDIRPVQALNLNASSSKLSQLLKPWPYHFDLYTGKLAPNAHATWSTSEDFRLTTQIQLEAAGGNIGEALFSGLSFNHELEVLPRIRSTASSRITLEHLDSGVTASNIYTDLQIQVSRTGTQPRLAVQGLKGEIFGGTFTADDFIYDLNRETNRFRIAASDIDLAAIMETQQLEHIEVTGKVDGAIPVLINKQGVYIEHGTFINKVRTGTIRYSPAAESGQLQQSPLTQVALDALKDFHYNHLSADVNFTPEGTLTINVQLKGTSPELDTNRPVHLNINTEQNLLSLLKSLRFAEGVSANIDRQVRRQYEQSGKQ
jgi:hypothetical protein